MKNHPSRPWLGLYKTKEWFRLRSTQLRKEPLCKFCKEQGYTTEATVVDHIKPHKGDKFLFSSPENLQSLCKLHHDSTKARIESRGDFGCDVDGIVNAWK